jgi:hypothetical protein
MAKGPKGPGWAPRTFPITLPMSPIGTQRCQATVRVMAPTPESGRLGSHKGRLRRLVDRALFALQFNGFDRAEGRCSVDPD